MQEMDAVYQSQEPVFMYPRSFQRLAKVSDGASPGLLYSYISCSQALGPVPMGLSHGQWRGLESTTNFWRSADVKACPANTVLRFICLLKAAGRPARAVGFLRRSLPDDILDFPADLFD